MRVFQCLQQTFTQRVSCSVCINNLRVTLPSNHVIYTGLKLGICWWFQETWMAWSPDSTKYRHASFLLNDVHSQGKMCTWVHTRICCLVLSTFSTIAKIWPQLASGKWKSGSSLSGNDENSQRHAQAMQVTYCFVYVFSPFPHLFVHFNCQCMDTGIRSKCTNSSLSQCAETFQLFWLNVVHVYTQLCVLGLWEMQVICCAAHVEIIWFILIHTQCFCRNTTCSVQVSSNVRWYL